MYSRLFMTFFVTLTPLSIALADDTMPVAQQNALVQKYCAVCHQGPHPNGQLSLEHFDAADADPGVAAMMLAKVKTGALGAAGMPIPDDATVNGWITALSAQATGAHEWTINRAPNTRSASIVQDVPSQVNPDVPDSYRLTITCETSSRKGEMQVAWSPATPKSGQIMSVAMDGKPVLTYQIEGSEKMGNGTNGSSGPGAATFQIDAPLPDKTLSVSDAFPNETVVFPFGNLSEPDRNALSTCFPSSKTNR